ncbi:ABC transporter permease [Bacteroidota bacterium]
MFNLEKEIKSWKKSLHKNQALEDGYIEELESHLRDEIEKGRGEGKGEEQAFFEAVIKIGSVEDVGEEYYKSDSKTLGKRPPWQTPIYIPEIMYNYFKVAYRNIKKQLGYSLINIIGLSIGIACVLFVMMYVNRLYNYDKYHIDYQQIYRVGLNITSQNETVGYALNVPPLAPTLKSQYPQVEKAARVFYWNSTRTVKHEDKFFYEEGFVYTDKELFEILSYNFIYGNPKTALAKPLSLVIPVRIADKIFGTTDALNKTLNIDGIFYTITGIIENAPDNTHLPIDIFVSMEDLNNPFWLQSWDWPGMFTYIKVKDGIDVAGFESHLKGIISENLLNNPSAPQSEYEVFLEPIEDIYLNSGLEYEIHVANPQLPLMLITIGIFILTIACFNYINLATVRMIKRFKEIGIRKILGAGHGQLFLQFINESFLMVIFSFIIALGILYFALPLFNALAEVDYQISMLIKWDLFLLIAVLLSAIVMISGVYPAITLSSFSPSKAIAAKGMTFKGKKIRRILVIGQFAMSVGLIFATLVVASQIDHLKNKSLGFNKESKVVLNVHGRTSLPREFLSIKDNLKNIPGINHVSVSSLVPGQGAGSLTTKSLDGNNPIEQMMYYFFIDSDFITFYDIKIIAGRNFYPKSSKDHSESCLVNKSAVQSFGWTVGESIGKQIITGLRNTTKTVVGVVDDFNYRGLQYQVEPLIIELDPSMFTSISLSADTNSLSKIIDEAEEIFSARFPGKPFDYFFLDEFWNGLYQSEERTGNMLSLFTMLSILIASLGLFGLVSFIAETKTKEIGVRKVLGCSTAKIINLMIVGFIKWIILANIISLPLAYYTMNNWLQNFPYRIDINIWIILITVGLSLLLALFTVLYQSVKSATANPINSLRYE